VAAAAVDAAADGSTPTERGTGAEPQASRGAAAEDPHFGRTARRLARRRRRFRALKITAGVLAGLVLVTGGGAFYAVHHLSKNIRSAPLYVGTDKKAAVGVEQPDAFGRTPYNLLLIGSDTRSTAADCAAGGDCGPGARADVEMIVHLSADRSNITVVSIPRDTVMDLPTCTDPDTHTTGGGTRTLINASLQWGPSCTAAAVHKLTGVAIDDFAMVDFEGVENISDALGGVDVCVDHSFYDKLSGLKLTAGTHKLEGKSALEFLRTRHAFGDGSDNVGRTSATHIFFSDMIDKLKAAGTLTNLISLYNIADAATQALTVSPDLDSAKRLVSLVTDLNKVPSQRITFATMQNDPDPEEPAHVVMDPRAKALFQSIINDQSLSPADGSAAGGSGSGTPTEASSSPATENVADASPSRSGDGDASGAASAFGASGDPTVTASGSDTAEGSNAASASGSAASASVDISSALDGAQHVTANQSQCVTVSTQYTEALYGNSGPGRTPEEMFAIYKNVPNSAP